MTAETPFPNPSRPRLALVLLPIIFGGCTTGTISSLSQAPVFLSEMSGSSGSTPATVGAVQEGASPPLAVGGNASLPLDPPAIASAAATGVASDRGGPTVDALASGIATLPHLPANPSAVAVEAPPATSAVIQTQTTTAAAGSAAAIGVGTTILGSGASAMTGAGVAAPSPAASQAAGGGPAMASPSTAATASASMQTGAAAAAPSAIVAAGQVLGGALPPAPANTQGAQNILLNSSAISAARMCLAMKACR